MESSIRHRQASAKIDNGSLLQEGNKNLGKTSKERKLIDEHFWLFIFAFFTVFFCLAHHESAKLPEPVSLRGAKSDMFIAERAHQDLLAITQWGKRIAGSPENEVYTVKYLTDQLEVIKRTVNPVHQIETDLQSVTGTFTLQFLGEFSSYYELVKNFLVKIGPKSGAEHSLLVSCHFDSVIGSPGASDDAVSCSLMLEVLRVLAQTDKPFKHNIVFNFNGAEENILQASHGFITQHKWAKDIRAFVNLDSAGSGGRELVFQTGPDHPWLVKAYADAAVYPFASIVGQEIFQSGLIPSDTDYRIYRDFGNIPGIDIAYIANGYLYHTSFDTADRIPQGCLQRGGENLLALVKSLANSSQLADPKLEAKGSVVFYDIIGKFLIMYPDKIGRFMNYLVAIVVITGILKKIVGLRGNGITGLPYLSNLLKAMGVMLLTWVATILSTIAMAMLMIAVGRRMSWYTHVYNMIGIYVCPALMANILVHLGAKKYLYKRFGNMWHVESLYFDTNMLIFSLIMIVMTYAQIDSAFLVLLFVLLPLIIKDRTVKFWGLHYEEATNVYLVIHLLAQAFPTLAITYLFYNIYVMFVPLMGRAGTEVNTEIFIGIMNATVVIINMAFQSCVMYVTKSMKRILLGLGSAATITFLLVLLTPLGFPYRYDPAGPTTQRHCINHIERHFHDKAGAVTKTDSGMWLVAFDNIGAKVLTPYLPELKDIEPAGCDGPYCGLPYYLPISSMFRKTYYIPGPKLPVPQEKRVHVKLTDRKMLGDNKQLLKFAVTGPDHIGVYFEVREGVNMTKWSIGNGDPHPTKVPSEIKRDTYWVYYAYAVKPSKPWEFWIELQLPNGHQDEPVLEVAFAGHYLHGEYEMTDFLRTYKERLPDWVDALMWSSTYDSFTY